MLRNLFAFALLAACLFACAFAATTPITIAGTVATVVNQLDTTTQQPQIKYWNNTNPNVVYLVTFVNMFESYNETKIAAVNKTVYQPTTWTITQDTTNPNVVNFTTTALPPAPYPHYKNITFSNQVNKDGTIKMTDGQAQFKAGKFDIKIVDYNFTDTHASAPLVLTFELNETDNNAPANKPLINDQSLNVQFGMAYFAVNNTATNKNPDDVTVSLFRASTQFNMTKNNTGAAYPISNMNNVYIFYQHFPNGTIDHDPEYGFGQGVPAAGKGKTIIIIVSVAAAVVVVAAVVAGCYVFMRKKDNRKNYQRF